MTTEEKRSRMTAMCRLNSIAPYNDCDRCKLRSVCRKSGHPPAYMSAETVELVFNDAVERGIFRDELTVGEMREKLVRICSTMTREDCLDGVCPIDESCDKCREWHIPEQMSTEGIRVVYADLVRLGKFKED